MTLAKFITTLHDEVLELRGEVQNFTSLLRCACLTYVEEVRGNADSLESLKQETLEAAKVA